LNDRVVAPFRIRFPATAPQRIDLLRALHAVPQASRQIWVRGKAVEEWFEAAVLDRNRQHPDLCASGGIPQQSRLDRFWNEQYASSGHNRVRDSVRLSDLEVEDLEWFALREDLLLTPEQPGRSGISRFIGVNEELMGLLGFYLAEGSCSDRNGIRLSIGKDNQRFAEEMAKKLTSVFGLPAVTYSSPQHCMELKLVNRVAALAWQHVFGFAGSDSTTKQIPDLAFNVSEDLRCAFLRGYLLRDGTVRKNRIAFSTSSYDIASGIVYALSSLGVVPFGRTMRAPRILRSSWLALDRQASGIIRLSTAT